MSLGEYLGAGSAVTLGLYHLNGNSNDISGNGNNGTNTSVTWVDGKFGQCARFNGTNAFTSLSTGMYNNNSSYTISLWGKRNQINNSGSNRNEIYSKSNSAGNGVIITAYGGNNRICFWLNDGSRKQANSPANKSNGVRYNVVAVKDGSNAILYIDGMQEASISVGTVVNGNSTHYIGRYYTTGFFDGDVDEVIIENRVRTPVEIQKYYTYTKGRFGI